MENQLKYSSAFTELDQNFLGASMKFFSLCLAFFSVSCTTTKAWTIAQSKNQVLVGYEIGREYNSMEILDEKIKDIGDSSCASGRWRLDNDHLKSKDEQGSFLVPVTRTVEHNGTVSDTIDGTISTDTSGSFGSPYKRNSFSSSSESKLTGTVRSSYQGTSSYSENQLQTYNFTSYWREVELSCLPSYASERKKLIPFCESKVVSACFQVAKTYDEERNSIKRNEYLKKSCDLGLNAGCGWVSAYVDRNPEIAIETFEKGCDSDEPESCESLGDALQKKEEDERLKNLENKLSHFTNLAIAHVKKNFGVTTKQQKSIAIEPYKKACNLGLESSCDEWKRLQQVTGH